jgi:ribosome-binding protein aMBF1 (putative translation factor)
MIAPHPAAPPRPRDGADDEGSDYDERARRVGATLLADLAAALGALRRARGLRQADVAALMGTSQSCVSDFERAKTNPQLLFVARYAAAVGAQLRVAVSDGDSKFNVQSSTEAYRLEP